MVLDSLPNMTTVVSYYEGETGGCAMVERPTKLSANMASRQLLARGDPSPIRCDANSIEDLLAFYKTRYGCDANSIEDLLAWAKGPVAKRYADFSLMIINKSDSELGLT